MASKGRVATGRMNDSSANVKSSYHSEHLSEVPVARCTRKLSGSVNGIVELAKHEWAGQTGVCGQSINFRSNKEADKTESGTCHCSEQQRNHIPAHITELQRGIYKISSFREGENGATGPRNRKSGRVGTGQQRDTIKMI